MSDKELTDAMKELAAKLREAETAEQEAEQPEEEKENIAESEAAMQEPAKEPENPQKDIVVESDCYWDEEKPFEGKKNGKKWVLPAIIGTVVALVAGVYLGGVGYYSSHYLPNITINGIKCANMKLDQLYGMLDSRSDYTFAVMGRDLVTEEGGATLGELKAEDIGLEYTYSAEQIREILQGQNKWNWLLETFNGAEQAHVVEHTMSFDTAKAQEKIMTMDAFQMKNMNSPKDAYISGYSAESKHYEIVPETAGTVLDADKAIAYLLEAIGREESGANLEEAEVYSTANVLKTEKKMVDMVEKINHRLDTRITYDWNGSKVAVDADLLDQWLDVNLTTGEIILDEEAVAEFVKRQAKENDTFGTVRTFHTSLGADIELTAKKYGWQTDVEAEIPELIRLIEECAVTDREPIYSVTAKKKGKDDIGDSYVECDLSNQHLYFYYEGELVKESDFVSGTLSSTKDCVTPAGIFGLTYKKHHAVLRGANYATPVTYWMPFYNNYGLHDATWRKAFGGEIYKRNGSHGCVNLPYSTAETIFEKVDTGFPVITYYYENGKNPAKDGVVEEPSTKPSESIPVMEETIVPEESSETPESSQTWTPPASSQPAESTPAESSESSESVPESSEPAESTPESSVPEESTPAESIPESSTPAESGEPAESIPESSETVPEQPPAESTPAADAGEGAE